MLAITPAIQLNQDWKCYCFACILP